MGMQVRNCFLPIMFSTTAFLLALFSEQRLAYILYVSSHQHQICDDVIRNDNCDHHQDVVWEVVHLKKTI